MDAFGWKTFVRIDKGSEQIKPKAKAKARAAACVTWSCLMQFGCDEA
jgi:hypothetical protein